MEALPEFSDGLYTSADPHEIPKTASPYIRNLLIDEKEGSTTQRRGYVIAGSTSTLMDGRFQFLFNKEDGTKEYIVSDSSMVLTTQDYQTYVVISSGLNTSVTLECTQLRNKVWCTNGSDAVFTWDGTVMTRLDGSGTTPNVPRFKFIATYQDRIFGGNTSASGSSLYFSSLVSTDGAILAPDDARAWPPLNELKINQGDGDVITALWVFRGQLQIGKSHSIYTLFGTGASSYVPRRTETQVGPISQDCVQVADGLSHFLGFDGIYAFDGNYAKRISDQIEPDVNLFNKDSVRIIQNFWETTADFSKGSFSGTTVTVSGVLTLYSSQTYTLNVIDNAIVANTSTTLTGAGTSATNFFVRKPTQTFESSLLLYPGNITIWGSNVGSGGSQAPVIRLTVKNLNTGLSQFTDRLITEVGDSKLQFTASTTSLQFTGSEVTLSSFAIKLEIVNTGTANDFKFQNPSPDKLSTIPLFASSTGQFISDVATISMITAWSGFESIFNTNSGNVSFFYRTSTSTVNIATQTWKSIIPGANIVAPIINKYIQWATSMTSIDGVNFPTIDNVAIKHIEGSGSNTRAFAAVWRNRYWLVVSTVPAGNITPIYVKAKATSKNPIAWTVFEGANIRSLMRDYNADTLYGGAASTGVFYRMDFGTNDNGAPIAAEVQTGELWMDAPFSNKSLLEYFLDADSQDSANLMIGLAVNGGTFRDLTISLTNPARLVRYIDFDTQAYPLLYGNFFRIRFRHSTLDKVLNLHNFGIAYNPMSLQSDTSQ